MVETTIITARPIAVRLAANLQLQRLWRQRRRLGLPLTAREFLWALPDALAKSDLGMCVRYVPEIGVTDFGGGAHFETAGCIDRHARLIVIASKFKREQQRFTLAHEVGHWLLHTGMIYHRDRPINDTVVGARRPVVEMEADLFAAELLMPRKYLRACFVQRFGSPDVFVNNDDAIQILADALNARGGLRIEPVSPSWRRSAEQLADLPAIELARLVAQVSGFGSKNFESLAAHFAVSPTAMAIQLLDATLVK
jgi:hypothetical protein